MSTYQIKNTYITNMI